MKKGRARQPAPCRRAGQARDSFEEHSFEHGSGQQLALDRLVMFEELARVP
jgi:hypothetical protein